MSLASLTVDSVDASVGSIISKLGKTDETDFNQLAEKNNKLSKFTNTHGIIWIYGVFGGLGVTAGSHRLWSHRSYKAKWQLKSFLIVCHAISNQNSLHKWVRDHRCHHKFSETDADPHNSKRGMFFAHIGWLLVNKHPDVIEKGKTIDMSDVENDPIAMFQSRYFYLLGPFLCFVVPTFIPWYFWGEELTVAWYVGGCLKFALISHMTWLINSAAHSIGMRPYDRFQAGTDNLCLKLTALGEAWHNYHHSFPWDYSCSELGLNQLNVTTSFIDFFSLLGWSYDKKTVPLEVIKRRVLRTGDGSHRFNKERKDLDHFWGWGDKDMLKDEVYSEISAKL